MSERKIIPITGKHTSLSSMLAEAMCDGSFKSGFIICFDEEGTMRSGHFQTTTANVCMAAAWLNAMAARVMSSEDE